MEELRTAEQAKAEIEKSGITIAKWAVKNGLAPSAVYAVLNGRLSGNYGDSHKAAVLLGMKKGNISGDEPELKRA